MNLSYYIDTSVPEMPYTPQTAFQQEQPMITEDQASAAAWVALRADHYATVDFAAYQTAKALADHELATFRAEPTQENRETALAAVNAAKAARETAAKSAGRASKLAMRAHELRTAYDAQN